MRCCEDALAHNGPADRRQRSQMMRGESWESRLERITAIIESRGASPPANHPDVDRESADEDCRELAVMTST
jgi:hypothetical protein